MTKQELVASVANACGVNQNTVKTILENAAFCVRETLASGEAVYIRGFGTLKPHLRKAKKARNITKGTTVVVPAHYIPKFIPSKEMQTMMENCPLETK